MLWILIFAFLCWVSVNHILCAKSSAGHCRDLQSKWKHRLLWKPPEGAYHTPWGSGRTSEWKLQWKLRPEWQSGKDRMEERRVQAAGPASAKCGLKPLRAYRMRRKLDQTKALSTKCFYLSKKIPGMGMGNLQNLEQPTEWNLPRWLSNKEPTCQSRRCRRFKFDQTWLTNRTNPLNLTTTSWGHYSIFGVRK